MDNLSSIGIRLNIYLAVTAALVSYFASIELSGIFADAKTMSGEAAAMYHYGSLFILLFAVASGFLTKNEIDSKNTLLSKIKTNVKRVDVG